MRQLTDELWVDERPLRFGGVEIGARMTVVRLPSGALLVHSPITATPERIDAVRALGPVTSLVAPNRLHHLSIGDWKAAFPGARMLAAPGLPEKRTDLAFDGVLGDAPEEVFEGAVEHICMPGIPIANDVVFFHAASATLILTDLAFNVQSPAFSRCALWAIGVRHPLSPSWLERVIIRDRPAFAAAMARVLAWPFDRAIIAHGDIVETGARPLLAQGYAWLGQTNTENS